MSKDPTLTVAGLKSLILARFHMERAEMVRSQTHMQKALGEKMEEERPVSVMIRHRFEEHVAHTLAKRLEQNSRDVPLLASSDLAEIVPSAVSDFMKAEGADLDADERKKLETYFEKTFTNMFELAKAKFSDHKDPYEEYWRWMLTVIDLATEREVLPITFLALPGAFDAITRRTQTREQYVERNTLTFNKFVDIDTMKKMFIEPMLDMMLTCDDEMRREIEKDIEAEVVPQLRERIEKMKIVFDAYLQEETARIYPTT